MTDRSFQSGDRRFALKIGGNELGRILKYCAEAEPLETGGILVGSYSEGHDVALVSDVSRAPCDSRSAATWFYRGIHGLQKWLHRLWKQDRYYLGEWHFHPGAKPTPSETDLKQIKQISESSNYCCPEPILLIIGGSTAGAWEVGVYVSPRSHFVIELSEVTDGRGLVVR